MRWSLEGERLALGSVSLCGMRILRMHGCKAYVSYSHSLSENVGKEVANVEYIYISVTCEFLSLAHHASRNSVLAIACAEKGDAG